MATGEGHVYAVGQPYHPDRQQWDERYVYQFRGGHQELIIFMDDPLPVEVGAIQRGRPEFALVIEPPVLLFLCQFGVLPWNDSPYSWHLEQEADRSIPLPPSPMEHALLTTMLVDARTGLIRALRACTFSPSFTQTIDAAVRHQAGLGWDPDQFDRTLAKLYDRYPTTESFLLAADTRCTGGD